MPIAFEISEALPAPPEAVYAAWMDSGGHSQMTGSPAEVSAVLGGAFSAWDGYIRGTHLAQQRI